VLEPRGFRVVPVTSGEAALAALAHESVDLVLLDILMPGLDGYEVCRRIRADEATAYLPVVMLTASGAQQRLDALEAGADDFVAKPFDQSELLARVASLARIKRYHDTVRRQAAQLASWNAELERRVEEQVQ
jgi:adenylate cyclase